MCHLNDKVTIIHGLTYSKRKHFRLQTIDRRGKNPADYAEKPEEWRILEAKERAAAELKASIIAAKEQKRSARESRMARYAKMAQKSGIAAPSTPKSS